MFCQTEILLKFTEASDIVKGLTNDHHAPAFADCLQSPATGHSPSVSDFCFAIRHLLLSLGELHCRQNKRKRN